MTPIMTLESLLSSIDYIDKPLPSTLEAYKQQSARSGLLPEAHERLALGCAESGLEAARAVHLAASVRTDPNHAVIRALLGLVRHADRWKRPEEVAGRIPSGHSRGTHLS